MALASLPLQSLHALSLDDLDLTPPRPPMNFTAEAGDQTAHLEWTSVDQYDVNHYKVYIRNSAGQIDPVNSEDTQIDINNLSDSVTYYFIVTAIDNNGNESKPSVEIGTTPTKVQAETQKNYVVAAWMPTNFDTEDAYNAFINNIDVFDIVSPFWFNLNPDGTLTPNGGARDKSLIDTAHSKKVLMIPTITNNYSSDKASQVLKGPGTILNHIDVIVKEVMDNNYDGIDIDYENVSAQEKDLFSFFMRNLAQQLHANGKLLTITSQPKLSDQYIWNGPGAIDWQVAGEVADYLRIMNYDYSRANTTPGPIAPKEWLRASMKYAVAHVPAEKVLGGIPFYGYDWALTDGGETSGLVWDGVKNTIQKYGITQINWDEDAGESWYEYTDEVGPRKAYFNDARSMEQKLQVITQEGAGGITIWRLGSEDPADFDMIRKYLGKEGRLYSPANVKVVPKNHSLKVQWSANTNDSTAVGHYVYMGTSLETLKKVADVKNANSYVASGLDDDTKYFVRITAYNGRGKESDPSNLAVVTPTDLVTTSPITNLSMSAASTSSITLSWSQKDNPDFIGNIRGYDVRYSNKPIDGSNWFQADQLKSDDIAISKQGTQSIEVKNLTPGSDYWFAVKTLDQFGQESALSNVIDAKTLDLSPPAEPQNVSYKKSGKNLEVTWDMGNDYDLAGYEILYQGADNVQRSVYVGLNNSYEVDFLNPEQIYSLSVVALDNSGNQSVASDTKKLILNQM
jgi:spore germination protein YaaH